MTFISNNQGGFACTANLTCFDFPVCTGSLAAEEGVRGWSALAGLGAARHWTSQPENGAAPANPAANTLGSARSSYLEALLSMRRFLSVDEPRIRVVGGSRFNCDQAADPEWASFGAFSFVLPQVEFLEASDCNLLACTLAWEPHSTEGPSSASQAVEQALAVLGRLQPPAPASAPAFQIQRAPAEHVPSEPEWCEQVPSLLQRLRSDAALSSSTLGLADVDDGLAKQEFRTNGQQGLDELLVSGFEFKFKIKFKYSFIIWSAPMPSSFATAHAHHARSSKLMMLSNFVKR